MATRMTTRCCILFLIFLAVVPAAAAFLPQSNKLADFSSAAAFLSTAPKRTRKLESRQLEFGDYGAYPDTCPLVTTCPTICVANMTDCPTTCPDGMQPCVTGVCQEDCEAYESEHVVESPCLCDTLSVACPKVVNDYDTCFEIYGDLYDAYTECVDAQEEALPQVDFKNDPYFVASYCIIGIVSGLVMIWCWSNRLLNFAADSSVESTIDLEDGGHEVWTFTGYKYHPVGMAIHAMVVLTLLGIQFELLVLVIFYYMQQEANVPWAPVFFDEVQVLMAFEIVWMVGFVWSFAFRYPSSIRDIFLRRCPLSEASFVAVLAPIKTIEAKKEAIPGWGEKSMTALWAPFDLFLAIFFASSQRKPGYGIDYCPVEIDPETGTEAFYFRMRRFVYMDGETEGNEEEGKSTRTASFYPGIIKVGETLGDFIGQSGGLTSEEAKNRRGKAGPNFVPMPKPTVLGSILKEFAKPFYLYQNFMVWTWAPYWYYYMAIVNTIVRVTGGVIVGIFQYMSDSVLYQLSHTEGQSTVIRDGQYVEISNAEIVPGDVVVLKQGVVCCDMAVLKAERLVVDESALTGEANPIVKAEIDPAMAKAAYDPYRHKRNILSAGTEIHEISEIEGKEIGLVLATGSFTTKGKLATDVLSYQRHKFKFDDEVKIVLCILIAEAAVMLGLVFRFIRGEQWVYAWFYGIFVVGTIIPPLLPTVFVVSVGISAKRLQSNRITCTHQEGILIAGKVDTAFFDKTGTLTKQGMDFVAVDAGDPELKETATFGLAVCHTLHKRKDGTLVGNQVDEEAFKFSGGDLIEKDGGATQVRFGGQVYTVLKQYEFDSHRQTQSVIVEGNGKKTIFVKGSPEAIRALCVSGVPKDLDMSVGNAAKTGTYQLAIASKHYDLGDIPLADITRDDVEKSLRFVALFSFQNSIREESPGVIRELLEGNVTTTMITGDSVLTGICIGRAAGIIPEGSRVLFGRKNNQGEIQWFDADTDAKVAAPSGQNMDSLKTNTVLAVTGEAWTALLQDDPKFAAAIAKHIRVFGRCNPSDKVSVVTHFVERGRKTLMCGDGGNDCGSLKAAHVGIALSTSEASVVAPFTSLDKCITSVSQVLREGRCALASAFAAYSYYIIYGQVESFLQVINAYFAITFTEWCWVFLDGVWSTLMAFSLPLASAAPKLSSTRPTASLLGPRTVFSVCGLLVWNFVFLCIGLAVLWKEDWFQCRKWNSDDVSDVRSIGDNYETTVLFMVGGYQYIASAIALNFGYTWRENFLKNYVFVFLALLFSVMHFVVTIYPSVFSCIWRVNCDNEDTVRWVTTVYAVPISNPWNTTVMPVEFRWKLVGIMAGNLIVLCLWQFVFVNGVLAAKVVEMKKGPSAANMDTNDEAPGEAIEVKEGKGSREASTTAGVEETANAAVDYDA